MNHIELLKWQSEEDRIKREYDRAYQRTIFCSESELPEANQALEFWRHKWFSH